MDAVSDSFCETMFEDMARDFDRFMVMWATFARVAKDAGTGNEIDFLMAFYSAKLPEFKPKNMNKAILSTLAATYLTEGSPLYFFAPGAKDKSGKPSLTKSNVRRIIRNAKDKIFPVMKKFFQLKKQELKQTSSFLVRFQIQAKENAEGV